MSSLRNVRSAHHSTPALVPANGQALTLAEQVDHEALSFKARGDSFGEFIAKHLSRLAELVRWTNAETPEDHEDRVEWWEAESRARDYDRGYQAGLDAARCQYGTHHGLCID
jgi:hypothetical protein